MKDNFLRLSLPLFLMVSAFALISTLAACSSSPATTPASTSQANTVTINLVAQNVAFDKSSITVPAGANVVINFNNKDSGIQHNFSLFTDSKATPPALFQGEIITGPKTITYTFKAPATPGTYFFRCDIHPTTMTGSFMVQ